MDNDTTLNYIIMNVCNGMMPMLEQKQLVRLKDVLFMNLAEYNISKKSYELITTIENNDTMKLEYFEMAMRLRNLSEGTISQYLRTAKQMRNFLQKNFVDVTTADVERYLATYTINRHWSATMVRNTTRYLNSFYVFLIEKKFITDNPMKGVTKTKVEETLKECFSQTELEKLRLVAKDSPRDSALVELLYASAIRVGELIKLKWYQLDMQHLCFIVYGKGKKERKVFFTERAGFYLLRYMEYRMKKEHRSKDELMERPLIANAKRNPNTHDYEAVTDDGIRDILKRVGKKANIYTKKNPHKFRRTFATDAINHGMPLEQVQKLLGHKNSNTTLLYAQIKNDTVEHSYRTHMD